ncbi:MAG: hypothetical protein J1E83_14095 [Lachnospiraceae bacterium]|nr:hypothetical protein [Lachnospiraceae bacterium]
MSALDRLSTLQFSSQIPDIKKAKIEIFDLKGNKLGEEIEVLFNPAQYTLSDSPRYSKGRRHSSGKSKMMYQGGSASTLDMELFLDTGPVLNASGTGNKAATDVYDKVKKFRELVQVKGEMHAPPIVKFIWGSLSFRGVVTGLKSTFTKFTESGMPIQAKLSLSLKEYSELDAEKRRSPFESPDRTKCRTIREDYNIWDMAKSEYGDMAKWKVIAKANNISNPLEILPGTIVKIPAL